MMKPDSPAGVKADPPLPELPFRFIIPCDGLGDGGWHAINAKIFYRIQRGKSLMDIDFTPPQPPPVQAETTWGGLVGFGLGLVAIAVIFGSRE